MLSTPPGSTTSPLSTYGALIDIQVDEPYAGRVDLGSLVAAIAETLGRLAVVPQTGPFTALLTLVITSDDALQELNRTYRGVDAPTDVLSFATPEPTGGGYLGDILIAFPTAERQAARFAGSTAAELRLLAVHGTLHLLGYDHATVQEEAAMWAMQDQIVAHFGDPGMGSRTFDP